ncbi:MAG: hypothetical protein LBI48_09385 [Burkholderiaceae bacterium]|jgi:hypothetical protein|nr:hypothetical protein [Burkholderiaceae bacterium]
MPRQSVLKQLAQAHDEQQLVGLKRKAIDRNPKYGFVLDFSKKLVFLHYVYDFHLDGLRILRTKDISGVRVGKTNMFQKQLLQDEGLFKTVEFGKRIDLTNWETALSQLMATYPMLILEYESLNHKETDFFIGAPLRCTSRSLSIRYFDGAGRWLDQPSTVHFSKLTCCQVNNNYLNTYQRYFERQAAQSTRRPKHVAKKARSL